MKIRFKLYLLLFLLQSFAPAVGQDTNLWDFIVTKKNDTIYGTLNNSTFIEIKKDTIIEHTLDEVITIKHNDRIYNKYTHKTKSSKDSIVNRLYDNFYTRNVRQKDYVITIDNDTIYGQIKNPFLGKKHLKTNKNTKIKINESNISSYRFNNEIYKLVNLKSPIRSIEKQVYLKQVFKGKANLYEYTILRSDAGSINPSTHYLIEKNNVLYLVSSYNFKEQLEDLFADNDSLADKIALGYFGIENLYLILKHYNSK